MAFTMARSIMAAVELNVFEALENGPQTAEQVAQFCKTNPKATRALLGALVGCRYVKYQSKSKAYTLAPVAKKWLIQSSPANICNKLKFQLMEWDVMSRLENYVRTGTAMDLHLSEDPKLWASYQAGMVDIGKLALGETVSRTPIPKSATRMLDIGGSGGTYSAAFLKKYPGLSSRILDLPSAVEHARPFVQKQGLGQRLEIVAGNVLTDQLEDGAYDFVWMANVAHHFSKEQNIAVAKKVFRALKPGGVFSILETERSDIPSDKNQMGAFLDLYFCLTSQSGTWSTGEIGAWLKESGYQNIHEIHYRTAPGLAQVYAIKK